MNKVDAKVATTRKQYLKWSFRPTFKTILQWNKTYQKIKV